MEKTEWNFAEYGLGNGEYAKNYEDIYAMVDTYGGVSTAIKYAKRRMLFHDIDWNKILNKK